MLYFWGGDCKRGYIIMKETISLGYSEYITDPHDSGFFKSLIVPKLKQKKPVNLYCSLSYFTSNYTGIFMMSELANLMKQGLSVYLVMWDINCQSHQRFRRIVQQTAETPEQIIQSKMDEIASLFQLFKAPMEILHLYRASDVFNRFMKKQEPNLFIQFYWILEKIKLDELVHNHKASHLIQMPLDVFFANFFHELYPEDLSERMEVKLMYPYQEAISKEVRNLMYQHEVTTSPNPLFLLLPPYPYLFYNNAIPDFGMSRDALVSHITACKPTDSQIMQMYYVVLKKMLQEFELLDNEHTLHTLSWDDFLQKHATLSLENQQVSLGYNIHKYLTDIKNRLKAQEKPGVLRLSSTDDAVKYSKLLSRKPMVEILRKIDGKKNATQLAKELKMAKSNMSTYLSLLKHHNLISIEPNGSIKRAITAINTNFEVGLHG